MISCWTIPPSGNTQEDLFPSREVERNYLGSATDITKKGGGGYFCVPCSVQTTCHIKGIDRYWPGRESKKADCKTRYIYLICMLRIYRYIGEFKLLILIYLNYCFKNIPLGCWFNNSVEGIIIVRWILYVYKRELELWILIYWSCPGWCGSVDWAPTCKLKCCQFNSQSGHMPGLRARPSVGGVWEANTQMFLSLASPLK